jgi:hypothetical protein
MDENVSGFSGGWQTSRVPLKIGKSNSAAHGQPPWLGWVNPPSDSATAYGSISPDGSEDLIFVFDPSQMVMLADHVFWVEIASDDPDFVVEADSQPSVQTVIEYHVKYTFVRGDVSGDGFVSVSDAVSLIQYIFGDGPPPDPLAAGDVNCDATVNVSDAVYLVNYIFTPASPAPGDPDGDGDPDC